MNLIIEVNTKKNDFVNKIIRAGDTIRSSIRVKKIFLKHPRIRKSVKNQINCELKFYLTELR